MKVVNNKIDSKKPFVVLVHWTTFGPFHIARLNAACLELAEAGIKVVGMETTSQFEIYPWAKQIYTSSFERHVALPGQIFERAEPVAMWRGVNSVLNKVRPHAIFVNGYSYHDAWSALIWCKLHRSSAIIMSDSKRDDAPRIGWKEGIKRGIVRQFDSALCAGKRSKEYLEQLGMRSERIFEGFDAVDNDYFWRGAEQARKHPDLYRSFPGLDSFEPFFLASARFDRGKNLAGLIQAYKQYRLEVCDIGRSPWRLVILGDGVERSMLEDLVRAEGIQGVSFAGFRQIDDLPIYYGLASVFIHPAFQDTWALVVNEAMAAGLPVIVSNRAGCAIDLVEEGINGFTFPPDDLSRLSDLMLLMSSNRVDIKAMGRASRGRIMNWGLPRFTQGLFGALQAALQDRHKEYGDSRSLNLN
jgi:1,2-diacylglycerol 3-alpha-glucosyltransferase